MNHLLAAMGITQWNFRRGESNPVAPSGPQGYSPLKFKYMFVALTSQVDQSLLSKIMQAINCAPSDANIILINEPQELHQHDWPPIPTIVFGEDLHAYTPNHAIRTVNLLQLNHDIAAKKSLWQALKQLS